MSALVKERPSGSHMTSAGGTGESQGETQKHSLYTSKVEERDQKEPRHFDA